MLRSDLIPSSDVDPFAIDMLRDPYESHQVLREAGPVVWLDRYDIFAAARFAEVSAGLGDHEAFCSSSGVGLTDFRKEESWRPPSLLLEADPPEHTMARGVVTNVLTPVVVREMKETFLDAARVIVNDIVDRGEFDGVEDLAAAYPLRVFPDLVGLPEDGRENLLPYGSMVFNGFGPRNEQFDAAMTKGAKAQPWILEHCRKDQLNSSGLGYRIHEVAESKGYSADDAGRIVRSFLSAGVDTTVHGIGNALYCLAVNPDQWSVLKADPSLTRAAFEEAIRFESPVQTFFRTTTRDTDLGGVTIPEGEKVLFFLGAANRDPRRWDAPDRYDIHRRAAGHVGFGTGIHACVGQMIARLEAECVLTALLETADVLELAGSPVIQPNNTLRGLDSLPLRVTKR